jgi:hypothetical protein
VVQTPRHRRKAKDPPHPCVTETFGGRVVTVSLTTGNVYAAEAGPVSGWHRLLAALWVWRVLNEHGFPTDCEQADVACGN